MLKIVKSFKAELTGNFNLMVEENYRVLLKPNSVVVEMYQIVVEASLRRPQLQTETPKK